MLKDYTENYIDVKRNDDDYFYIWQIFREPETPYDEQGFYEFRIFHDIIERPSSVFWCATFSRSFDADDLESTFWNLHKKVDDYIRKFDYADIDLNDVDHIIPKDLLF